VDGPGILNEKTGKSSLNQSYQKTASHVKSVVGVIGNRQYSDKNHVSGD
jgi:hypothetical protein